MPHATYFGLDWPFTPKRREKKLTASSRQRSHLEEAASGRQSFSGRDLDALWLVPYDSIAAAYHQLALVRMIQGGLIGAASVLRESAPRTEALGFPQGPVQRRLRAVRRSLDLYRSRSSGPSRVSSPS